MTKTYHLWHVTTSTGDSKASLKITRKGTITSLCFGWAGIGGAAIDGRYRVELSKQSSSAFSQNDKPNTVICTMAAPSVAVASSAFDRNALLAGVSIPVDVGDTLYLHQILDGGTAHSSMNTNVTIAVNE